MDAVISSLLIAACCAILFVAARAADRRIAIAGALLAAACIGLDDFVTGLPHLVPALSWLGGAWNWDGKILSLLLSALVIAGLKPTREALGLVAPVHVRTGVIALVLFTVWGATLGRVFLPGAADAETLAFQATMPGLAEELVYRGIAPALLLRAAPARTPWAVVLATAVGFGLIHGLGIDHGKPHFDVMSALFPFLGSIPGGWLRFHTRSLVFPVLGHGIANVAFHIAGGL